ncbi:hypothetical protein SY83_06200 [Paenibacillus swuensis]|uniref:Uncharacterized protein n=1 Tax=Paenibacillus swuensis TaxID=1178515 RepID=A0A172TG84_9BACL|nr:hypothetical protein [Paenibacillus swuensis]ANE45946.1 hypothetical protein SY83_06200 [Paenibacillus swuensis]
MGVKHARSYQAIIVELMDAIKDIGKFYEFFEMNSQEWVNLSENDQKEVLEALADDVFYGLGANSPIAVGEGFILHDQDFHLIEVQINDQTVKVIKLV